MVGCVQSGEALVVDPARNIAPYLQMAEENGLKITQVTETHIHADFVSGSRELAAATGAQLYLSDMGDADWKYAYADEAKAILVRDGDHWMLGNVRVEVMHTPGHTPEHISFIITDTLGADRPMGVFTGDFVFVGDVGRPDLLEEAAGIMNTKEPGARKQFQSVQRFKSLPDYLQIWPGHGAGSACGKALGAIPSTTLGYEKLFNPAFQYEDEDEFVTWLLDGQPEAPRYFAQMKHVNKVGPALLRDLPEVPELDAEALQSALEANALVVDLRDEDVFAAGYVPSTVNIPDTSSNFSTYVGWLVDFDAPLYFIPSDREAAANTLITLRAIGVDNIPGYFLPETITPLAAEKLTRIQADELAERRQHNGLVVLDVRGKSEYQSQHIANALHVPLGYIPQRLDTIPRDRTIVTQCASGYRSAIAASLLRKYGYSDVINLNANEADWARALPVESN
ncbi:MAG: MBL fold metallo-hydrolase, partial [Anaerolineae bacterium]|nr:MBL fold metallo-hydrolase [Anaerolineae bacterium]